MTKLLTLTTSKMTGETERQYTAWRLYCEAGSLQKTLKLWDKVGQSVGEMEVEFASRLGNKPSDTSLERWSKKFRWVERAELKLAKEIEDLSNKLSKINQKRKYQIAIAFGEILDQYGKQLRDPNKEVTVYELKTLWEMMRVEFGESIGKHEIVTGIDETQQNPPTEEEKELGRKIDQAIIDFYDEQARKQSEERKQEN